MESEFRDIREREKEQFNKMIFLQTTRYFLGGVYFVPSEICVSRLIAGDNNRMIKSRISWAKLKP